MSASIISFVVVLGVLVFFHELGHFLVARLFGVGVEKFSLGFGPRIFGRTAGITDYRVSAIPLGGYVKMVGEEPDAELDEKDIPISFTHKPVYQRILIVAAGPLFNLLLAVLIFFFIFLFSGTFVLNAVVGEVQEDMPAHAAGLKKGDRIMAVNGVPVENWDQMAERITKSDGQTLTIAAGRNGEVFNVDITPKQITSKNIFGEDIRRYVIGITSSGDGETRPLNPFEAFTESLVQTYRITELTVVSVVKIIQGSISSKTLGGPIMIAQMSGEQAREGMLNLVFFIALLSINLAILNFLPIPVLDGGHLMFFFMEALIGRPVNKRMREIAQQVGIFVLLLLMIYVFYNDIARIFSS